MSIPHIPYVVDFLLFFANKAGVLLEGGDMFVENSDCFIRFNLACPRSILEEGLGESARQSMPMPSAKPARSIPAQPAKPA